MFMGSFLMFRTDGDRPATQLSGRRVNTSSEVRAFYCCASSTAWQFRGYRQEKVKIDRLEFVANLLYF